MTAFGPFPATENIDFSALGDHPLFLINGPTGSGKTTILDAICFALYGKTTGDERDGAQMRCDLAAAETLCEVTFEFELDGRHYRISRIPEQQRPKARGEGLTDQKPTATLVEISDTGAETLLVAAKVSDATREIEALTGLSVDQFRQVMILPQGKFRQLLLAESAEREKIFSQLFQTHIYKQLENRLKEQAVQVKRDREALFQQQQGILETIEVESAEELVAEITELQPQVEAALAAKQQAEAVFLDRTKDLQQGEALWKEFDQFEQAAAELKQLNGQQNQIEQQRQQLKNALEAEKLRPLFVEQQRCAVEVEGSEKNQSELQRQLTLDEEALQQAQRQLPQTEGIVKEQDRCKAELVRLGEQRKKLVQLEALRGQCTNLQQRMAVLTQLTQLHEKEQSLQQLKNLATLASDLSRITRRLEREKLAGQKLAKLQEDQTASARQLELAWHCGQAAILAAELETGQPCPVCGSLDHPAPAHSESELPSQSDLEKSREVLQKTTKQLEEARDQYRQTASERDQLQLRHDELRQQIDPAPNYEQLASEVSTLRQQLAASGGTTEIAECPVAELAEKQLEEQRQLTTVETEIALLEKELPEEYRQLDRLETREDEVQRHLKKLEQQCETLVAAQQQAKEQFEKTAATLKEVSRQLEEFKRQSAVASDAAQTALAASCFDTAEFYRQSLRDEPSRQQLQTTIETFNARLQNLTGAYEQRQQSLKDKTRPDLDALRLKLVQAEAEKTQIETEWNRYNSRLGILVATHGKLADNQQQLKDLDDRYAVVGTLSDVANGQTGQKISLQRFVLSVLLDDVLLVASERFSLMSKGRYQLLRNEDRSKGNKASGLNLLVDDAYTGKVRPVATLSGGESFMAALSLALGLSDVVQAHAGGIHLDTLFIDEGFGSLDPESLDLAIRTLIDLQSSGRMIGVISHVAELKEQIALRIDVVGNRSGSSIKLVV
jgi:exonuclease SbcC